MVPHFAAAPPRVACPACGAAIHPVAGRCRHCHADLTRAKLDGPRAATPTAPARSRRPRLAFVAVLMLAVAVAAVVPLGAF